MENIIKCLDQLNALLTAAGKVQPGQVAHKVAVARSELEDMRVRAECCRKPLADLVEQLPEFRVGTVKLATGEIWDLVSVNMATFGPKLGAARAALAR